MSVGIVLNGRYQTQSTTGVQRYAHEIYVRNDDSMKVILPGGNVNGLKGHAWEQFVLPHQSKGSLLFSPCNTGPLFKKNQVVTIHDVATFDVPDAFTGMFARWYRWLLPRLAKRVRKVITVSEFSKSRMVALWRINPDQIHVIKNGVTVFPDHPNSVSPHHRPYFLTVGSRDPRKNTERLIKAYSSLGNLECDLIIVGGEAKSVFASSTLGEVPKGVVYAGRVSDEQLRDYYRNAQAFLFPSLYEGFGLPPLEAMSYGCPVISSSSTSLPEILGPGVDAGGGVLYFDPNRTDSISQSILRFLSLTSGEIVELSTRCKSRASLFSWDEAAKQTRILLDSILEANRQ